MAEGLLRHLAGDRYAAFSAGVAPDGVRPEAVAVMREIGIDIAGHRSKPVEEFDGQEFDYAITVCDPMNEGCPVFPGTARYLHWSFEDPAGVEGTEAERLAAFRDVRDRIRSRLESFLFEQGLRHRAAHG